MLKDLIRCSGRHARKEWWYNRDEKYKIELRWYAKN